MVHNYFNLLEQLSIFPPRKINLVNLQKNKKPMQKDFIGVYPCSIFPYKSWKNYRWRSVITYLSKKNNVVVIGSKEEKVFIDKLLGGINSKNISNLAGILTLSELIQIMPTFKLLIGIDGGPMHIASSMGVPTITLFGHESPSRYKPFGENAIALYNPTPCSPCVKSYADLVPTCTNARCLSNIKVQDVKESINKLLK